MTDMLIELQLTTRTALHIGGNSGNAVTDDLLRRNAQGKIMIPGSAIAGSLRATITRLAPRLGSPPCRAIEEDDRIQADKSCDCWVCALFGEVNPQEGNAQSGSASRLWVYDALYDPEQIATTAIRDGVGINRSTGAAARQGSVKFNMEVVPAGTAFTLSFRLQPTSDETIGHRNEHLLTLALDEWQQERGTLGGRVARGLGSFTVTHIAWQQRDLQSVAGLMAFLQRNDEKPDRLYSTATTTGTSHQERVRAATNYFTVVPSPLGNRDQDLTAYAVARSWAEVALTLHFTGPMLINHEAQTGWSNFDHAPVAATANGTDWILPGSSLRGVIRSQAERIARTVVTQWAAAAENPRDFFLQHNPAGDPNQQNGRAPLANSDALLTQAGVDGDVRLKPVHLDLADRLFGSVRLGSRLIVEDGALVQATIQPSRGVALKAMDFLAIDRFTGGGRDSAKFDAAVLWQPTFTTRLRIDNPQGWELGWLLLTLRDLHEEFTTIGFGAAKGFGGVQIAAASATLGWLLPEDFPATALPATAVTEQGLWQTASADYPSGDTDLWRPLLAEWVDQFQEQLQQFQRIDTKDFSRSRTQKSSVATVMGTPRQIDDAYFTKDKKIETWYPMQEAHHE